MKEISELIEEVANTLSDTAQSDIVVGQAVELGSAKIIPLSKVGIGFGGAGGEGDAQFNEIQGKKEKHHGFGGGKGKGHGSGAGGGARVRPVGVVIFTEDGVRVEKIADKTTGIEKIFEKIPEVIELAKKHKE